MSFDSPATYAFLPNDDTFEAEFDYDDGIAVEATEFEYDDDSGRTATIFARLEIILASPRVSLVWAFCVLTAIYTTKQLLVSHGFHYPFTLAFRYFTATFTVFMLMVLGRGCWQVSRSDGSINLQELVLQRSSWRSRWEYLVPTSNWLWMLSWSLTATVSLLLLLQGMLHMPSLPALVMISPLAYATESLILKWSLYKDDSRMPWAIVVVISASGLVLYNENRLMIPGLLFGVTGVLSFGISRACWFLFQETARPASTTLKSHYNHFIIPSLLGLLSSGALSTVFEKPPPTWPTAKPTAVVMTLNIIAVIGTTFLYDVGLMTSSFDHRTSTPDQFRSDQSSRLAAFLGLNCLLLVAMFSSPIPYVTWIQIAAFLASNASFLDVNQFYDFVLSGTSWRRCRDAGHSKHGIKLYASHSLLVLMITVISLILASASSAWINTLSTGPATAYDLSYRPESRFDIVVSMYMEEPASVKQMIDQIRSTEFLQQLNLQGHRPNIIIYTKNPDIDLNSLKESVAADTIKRLDNVGREGGTYLTHIVDRWDSLAEQTMFIQGHAHNIREMIPRVSDYLQSNTGMLSLGFTGVSCHCGSCNDRWSWEDSSQLVPSIYERIYERSCDPSQPILLSYKGQFVASARRIRGIKQEVYVDLLEALTRDEGWHHNGSVTRAERQGKESLSNPSFGFSLERIWSLVMQCANERVAVRCPSLLSGKGFNGRAEDCQCLDV